MTRDELIEQARRLGISRAEHLTRAELRDEIVRRTEADAQRRRAARGWFGVARDLVASVVEAGLHLPDAARVIRGELAVDPRYQPPVATVTLAEIYAAQGHLARALKMLDEVLAKEADHEAARVLRQRLATPPTPAQQTSELEASAPEAPDAPDAPDANSPREHEEPQTDVGASRGGDREPASATTARESAAEPVASPDAPAPESSAPAAAADGAGDPLAVVPPESSAAPAKPLVILEDALFLARKGGKVELYWELTTSTEQRLRQRQPGGRPVIRLVSFTPVEMRADRQQHDRPLPARHGMVQIECGAESAVRAALGWHSEQGFRALAVATHVAGGRPAPANAPYVPRGSRDPEARARALEQFGMV